jgi:cytidylate kinase
MNKSTKSLPHVIAIDGPAASGKSTVGQMLAKKLGYLYFDTGVMYRAVALAALDHHLLINDEIGISHLAENIRIEVNKPTLDDGRMYDVVLDGKDVTWKLRQPDVEAAVSPVASYPGVRNAMTEQQRVIGKQGNVVMVGRDIGTVVLPDAELKIFLEASVEERAQRRYKELIKRGKTETFEVILTALKERDRIDSTRKHAPLKPAKDAKIVNTDQLDQQEVVSKIMEFIK